MIIIKLRGYMKQEDLAKIRNGYIRQIDEGILVVDDRLFVSGCIHHFITVNKMDFIA